MPERARERKRPVSGGPRSLFFLRKRAPFNLFVLLPAVDVQDPSTGEFVTVPVPPRRRRFTGHNPINLAMKFARRVAFEIAGEGDSL